MYTYDTYTKHHVRGLVGTVVLAFVFAEALWLTKSTC